MKKDRIALFCSAALVAAGIGLNIQNALANYGIGENSLSLIAAPDSNSNSNSNSFSEGTEGFNVYSLNPGIFDKQKKRFWYCPTHQLEEGYSPENPCTDPNY